MFGSFDSAETFESRRAPPSTDDPTSIDPGINPSVPYYGGRTRRRPPSAAGPTGRDLFPGLGPPLPSRSRSPARPSSTPYAAASEQARRGRLLPGGAPGASAAPPASCPATPRASRSPTRSSSLARDRSRRAWTRPRPAVACVDACPADPDLRAPGGRPGARGTRTRCPRAGGHLVRLGRSVQSWACRAEARRALERAHEDGVALAAAAAQGGRAEAAAAALQLVEEGAARRGCRTCRPGGRGRWRHR